MKPVTADHIIQRKIKATVLPSLATHVNQQMAAVSRQIMEDEIIAVYSKIFPVLVACEIVR